MGNVSTARKPATIRVGAWIIAAGAALCVLAILMGAGILAGLIILGVLAVTGFGVMVIGYLQKIADRA